MAKKQRGQAATLLRFPVLLICCILMLLARDVESEKYFLKHSASLLEGSREHVLLHIFGMSKDIANTERADLGKLSAVHWRSDNFPNYSDADTAALVACMPQHIHDEVVRRDDADSRVFLHPVDGTFAPDYYAVVKNPIDLTIVSCAVPLATAQPSSMLVAPPPRADDGFLCGPRINADRRQNQE